MKILKLIILIKNIKFILINKKKVHQKIKNKKKIKNTHVMLFYVILLQE